MGDSSTITACAPRTSIDDHRSEKIIARESYLWRVKTRFDMVGRLDGVRRTPQGGIQASANLTRVGVFEYLNPDGSKTREGRLPDDVFKADALESLKLAPLTVGHPGMVTPENYKTHAVGVIATDVRADGKFVKATILIQDADACARVEAGELVELSCGYEVEVLEESGEIDGEAYDSRQVGHKYNHVALGPANWGRAGSDVRLTLDAAGNARADSYCPDMTIKTDALPTDAQARLDAITGERDALKAELDATRAKYDAAEAARVGAVALNAKLIDPAKVAELVANRVSLEGSARSILGAEFKAKTDKGESMSDREVMLAALVKHDPKFDGKDRSDEYLRARFDMAADHASASDKAVAELVPATKPETKIDAGEGAGGKSALEIANENAAADRAKSAAAGAPAGSLTRKS